VCIRGSISFPPIITANACQSLDGAIALSGATEASGGLEVPTPILSSLAMSVRAFRAQLISIQA
jgi:hypothetical protein